jgi:hypothetical protein
VAPAGDAPARYFEGHFTKRFAKKTGSDMTAAKCNRTSEEAHFLKECEMELARGASHIASMLHAETIHAAVKETALLFETSHGRDDLNQFLLELARKLEQRGKPEAVAVLQDFIKGGRSREIEELEAIPSFIRQSPAQKPQGARSQNGKASATADVARKNSGGHN